MRGALNAILQLSPEQRQRGVVTHSSGNFAQALALAAASLGCKAYIVMPNNAPHVKKNAVLDYGGEVHECEPTLAARDTLAMRIVHEQGATFIHPSNDLDVILGQGTAALELLQDHPNLERLYVPVGGGGLIAGCSLAAHFYSHPVGNCLTIGGEPLAVDDAYRSLLSGHIELPGPNATIADGLRTQLGDINFPIIQRYVRKIVRVEERSIVEAMRWIWERMKIVIEPSSAVAIAALLEDQEEAVGREVGVIISGGNVDLAHLPF